MQFMAIDQDMHRLTSDFGWPCLAIANERLRTPGILADVQQLGLAQEKRTTGGGRGGGLAWTRTVASRSIARVTQK